ncbi:MAG: ion transporter [Pseudomonadota bacterium]
MRSLHPILSDRRRLAEWLETLPVRWFIICIILLNAVLLGVETSENITDNIGVTLNLLDRVCLAFFVFEIAVKIYAFGPKFFRTAWNLFDFVIVAIALVPGSETIATLRALRILRLLRVVSVAPRLRRVVEGFVAALPGMGSVFLLMGLIFYISSVMATTMFSETFPQWFGTLGQSAYSLFQIMTLESWSMGIVRPVMEVHAWAWAFFVPFIMVTTFAVVNLLVGLIVNSMQDAHHEDDVAQTDAYREDVLGKLAAIEARLDRMTSTASENRD